MQRAVALQGDVVVRRRGQCHGGDGHPGTGAQGQQGAWVQGGKHHSKQEEARLAAKRKMAKNKDFLKAHCE